MIIRNGAAALVNNTRASYTYGQPTALLMKSTVTNLFYHFGLPADLRKGATVLTATVRIPQSGGPWPGGRTMTLRRVASRWTVGQVTWNNQPGVVTGSSTGVTTTDTANGYVWEFTGAGVVADVQAMVNSGSNYGWRLATSDAVGRYLNSFNSSTAKPTLEITYAYLPATPTSLHPSAGAVSIASPVLSWNSDTPAQVQVQVDPAANGTTPVFDSGWVVSTDEQFPLAGTTYGGLSDGASTQWRVRVKNSAGQISSWSTWATFNRVNKPVLTIVSPTTVFSDTSPVVDWTFAGVQTKWQAILTPLSPGISRTVGAALRDSRVVPGVTSEYTFGEGNGDDNVGIDAGGTWKFTVRVWDNVDREGTVGDPIYIEASTTAVMSLDPTVTAVTWLTAEQALPAPWVDIKWSRVSQPDGWTIYRDGVPIYTTTDASSLFLGETVYGWRDWTAHPNREHVYRAAAVTNGKTASGGPTETLTPVPAGIWLANPVTGAEAVLWGQDEGTWAYGEDSTVYLPIGASSPVRVTHSMRGLEGTLSGLLLDVDSAPDYPVETVRSALYAMKSDPSTRLRMVAGDINIPVIVHNLVVAPSPLTEPDQRLVNVSFEFEQVGTLPYSPSL